MYGFYYDPTYVMVLIGVVICMLASANVNRTFQKYSRIRSHSGMTGHEAAERLLHANGIYDVTVQHVAGNLTDHYENVKSFGFNICFYFSCCNWCGST